VVMVCAGATHSQRRLQSKRHVECHKNHQTICMHQTVSEMSLQESSHLSIGRTSRLRDPYSMRQPAHCRAQGTNDKMYATRVQRN